MRATSSNIGQLLKQRGDGKETAKKFSPMIDPQRCLLKRKNS